MRLLPAVVLAAVLLPGLALADCFPVNWVTTVLLVKHPHWHAVNLAGASAKKFIGDYNAIPPTSTWAADQVLIFDHTETTFVEVVLFVQVHVGSRCATCLCHRTAGRAKRIGSCAGVSGGPLLTQLHRCRGIVGMSGSWE